MKLRDNYAFIQDFVKKNHLLSSVSGELFCTYTCEFHYVLNVIVINNYTNCMCSMTSSGASRSVTWLLWCASAHVSGRFRIIDQVRRRAPVWVGQVFRQSSASLTVQYSGVKWGFELGLQHLFCDHCQLISRFCLACTNIIRDSVT